MRAARLAGSGSARNCEASPAVGRVPMTSRKARRRKTASELRLAGRISSRLSRSKTRASIGDCADRGAALSKVVLRARSAPVAAAVAARKIANRENRIPIAEFVYRREPRGGGEVPVRRTRVFRRKAFPCTAVLWSGGRMRSEEHTSELQSLRHI